MEKNFYGESKRREDLEKRVKEIKFEVDQLLTRKEYLVKNTDDLSGTLKESIQRSENLRNEAQALEQLVGEYEVSNRRIIDEMEDQANQNEEIVNQLQRKTRV